MVGQAVGSIPLVMANASNVPHTVKNWAIRVQHSHRMSGKQGALVGQAVGSIPLVMAIVSNLHFAVYNPMFYTKWGNGLSFPLKFNGTGARFGLVYFCWLDLFQH